MIKAKQTERESKRLEGDVKKEQRHLNHTLKELDVGKYLIYIQDVLLFKLIFLDSIKKRFDTEKYLAKNLEEKDRIEREYLRKKEQVKIL